MMNHSLCLLLALSMILIFVACDNESSTKATPLTTSKDFWIDRCEIKYQGKDFPITGTIDDMVKLLGPYRFVEWRDTYLWDDIGLLIHADKESGSVKSVDLMLTYQESTYEESLRLSDDPKDKETLALMKTTRPKYAFKGDVVMEGAAIGQEIDFEQVNSTREEYLKTQTGPDAHLIPISRTRANTLYVLDRTCANGGHLGFVFITTSAVPPYRIESLGIGSNNAKNSTKNK